MKNTIMIITTLLLSLNAFALQVPELTGPVVDKAQVLSNHSQLESKIRTLYKNGTGPQVNILTIPTLEGDNLESFAHKVFTTWKLGDAKRDDGVLFLIVINDRKMRIEVGQGLEGGLTDLQSKHILASLKSYFRSQDYNGGIESGLDQIIQEISKPEAVQQPVSQVYTSPTNTQSSESSDETKTMFGLAALFLGIGFVILRVVLSYYHNYNQQVLEVQHDLEASKLQESKNVNKIQKLKEQISQVEKTSKMSLSQTIEKMRADIDSLVKEYEEKEDKYLQSKKEEKNCPVSKLNTLQRNITTLSHELNISKSNINKYQQIIKEGK